MKITYPLKTVSDDKEAKKESEQLSSWQKMIQGIVRPPRSTCKDPYQNVKSFRMNETVYHRSDFTLTHNSKKIELTVFDPDYKNGWIILYLHGNSSSKVEAYTIREFLPFQYSMAAFDFMGCGRNFEEETVSLGYRESQQVETVVKFLNQKQYKVIIWGRSMGAATALKFGKACVIVADSAFKSFRSLCKQVAKRNSPCWIPNCLISCLFPCVFCKIHSDIEQKGGYDVDYLDIAEDIKKIDPSTLVVFLSGDEDLLIDKKNSIRLHEMYVGMNKHLQIFKGTHNTKRPPQVIKKVMAMIHNHVREMQTKIEKGTTLEQLKDPASA